MKQFNQLTRIKDLYEFIDIIQVHFFGYDFDIQLIETLDSKAIILSNKESEYKMEDIGNKTIVEVIAYFDDLVKPYDENSNDN